MHCRDLMLSRVTEVMGIVVGVSLFLAGCSGESSEEDRDPVEEVLEDVEIEDRPTDPSDDGKDKDEDGPSGGGGETMTEVVAEETDEIMTETEMVGEEITEIGVQAFPARLQDHTFDMDDWTVSLTYQGSTLETAGMVFQDFQEDGEGIRVGHLDRDEVQLDQIDSLRYVYFASLELGLKEKEDENGEGSVVELFDEEAFQEKLLNSHFYHQDFTLSVNCETYFVDKSAAYRLHSFVVLPQEEDQDTITVEIQLAYYQENTADKALFAVPSVSDSCVAVAAEEAAVEEEVGEEEDKDVAEDAGEDVSS